MIPVWYQPYTCASVIWQESTWRRVIYPHPVGSLGWEQTQVVAAYLSRHIKLCSSMRTLRLTMTTRLSEAFASTAFAKCAFRCSAPATWNSLPRTVTDNDLLGTFKSRLKTFLFSLAFNWHWHHPPQAPLKLRPNGANPHCTNLLLLLLLLTLPPAEQIALFHDNCLNELKHHRQHQKDGGANNSGSDDAFHVCDVCGRNCWSRIR